MRNAAAFMALLAVATLSCRKEPGEGGRGEITGRVMEQRYNNVGQPTGPRYPAAEQRVYIIYGDGTYHDDDVRCGADGRFRFPWLRKGSYTVYTVSECRDFDGCTFQVAANATINKRKDVVDVGDLLIQNH